MYLWITWNAGGVKKVPVVMKELIDEADGDIELAEVMRYHLSDGDQYGGKEDRSRAWSLDDATTNLSTMRRSLKLVKRKSLQLISIAKSQKADRISRAKQRSDTMVMRKREEIRAKIAGVQSTSNPLAKSSPDHDVKTVNKTGGVVAGGGGGSKSTSPTAKAAAVSADNGADERSPTSEKKKRKGKGKVYKNPAAATGAGVEDEGV